MKFLIIAGPYEADIVRRAALRSACEALAIDAADGLDGWITASRPDVIVLAPAAMEEGPHEAAARVRAVPGGDVPLVMICDESEREVAGGAGDLVLVRPVVAEALVDEGRRLIEARAARTPAQVRARTFSPEPPSSLRPLAPERRRAASDLGGQAPAPAMSLRQFSASIDQLLDAEMAQTLSQVSENAVLGTRTTLTARAPQDQTREAPRELVATILAESRALVPAAHDATTAGGRGKAGAGMIPAEGELTELNLPSLLGEALQGGVTGRLRLRQGEVEKSIFFEAGRPVLAVSNAPSDRMVQMMVRQGVVSPDTAAKAVEIATRTSRRMGAVLVDLGCLKSSELLPVVRQHYEEIVFSLFAWRGGNFRLEMGTTPDPRRVRLLRHPAALVLEGLQRSFDRARLEEVLGGTEGVLRLESHAGAPDILLELAGGDPGLSRIPVLFDGVRTTGEVLRISAQPADTVLQFAVTLRAFGLFREQRRGESQALAPEPVNLRDVEIDRGRVAARTALVQEGDYFQILGVSPDAGSAEVRQAYERLAREFSDASVGAELARELAGELADLRGVLREALQILGRDDTREAYRRASQARRTVAEAAGGRAG